MGLPCDRVDEVSNTKRVSLLPDKCLKWKYFQSNLHKIVLTLLLSMGLVDSHTDLEVPWCISGMGRKVAQVNPGWVSAGVQQTPTLQSFSPSNSALLNVQL